MYVRWPACTQSLGNTVTISNQPQVLSMDTNSFPIIYIVVSVLACAMLHLLNRRTGMTARHREHGMVAYFGMQGENTGGAVAVDSKGAFALLVLCAVMIGGALGWGIPELWMVTSPTKLDRAAQLVGAVSWAISAIHLITWFFLALKLAIIIGITAAVIVFPIQYIMQGKVGFDIERTDGFGIENKFKAWREALKEKKLPPRRVEANRTKPENLIPFVGMWKFDVAPAPFRYIEITKSGTIRYFESTRWVNHTAPLYGNKTMVLTEELTAKDGRSFLFETVSTDKLDFILDPQLKMRLPLVRVGRDAAIKDAVGLAAAARIQAEANRAKWAAWEKRQAEQRARNDK